MPRGARDTRTSDEACRRKGLIIPCYRSPGGESQLQSTILEDLEKGYHPSFQLLHNGN